MEDLRIRGLQLKEVGVFKDLDLAFPEGQASDKAEIHIFVGENGTGKTTLLEAMTCFEGWYGWYRDGKGEMFRKGESGWRVEPKMKQSESFFSVDLSGNIVGKSNGPKGESAVENPLDVFFQKYFHGDWSRMEKTPYLFFAYNANRFLKTAYVKPGRQFFDLRLLVEGISWDKEDVNEALFQWVMDSDTKAAFALRRNAKEEALKYEAGLQKINSAISDILGRPISFVIDEQRLRVRVNVQDEMIDAEQLALGYKSLIGWLADLIYRLSQFPDSLNARFTLFLDEIDVHLHPKAQRRILPVLQKLFPKAQIFLTTQSPFIIGSVDDAWVYKFKLDADGNSVLDGQPRRSEDAQSYRHILEDIFDVHEQFGIEAERQLAEFYTLRKDILTDPSDGKWAEFNRFGEALAKQTAEMAHIINFELHQVGRILKKEVSL